MKDYAIRSAAVTFKAPVSNEPPPWGWAHIPHPDPAVIQIHVMPLSDTGCHSFDLICACGCHEDDPGFIHHHAFDGRERYEGAGEAKKH